MSHVPRPKSDDSLALFLDDARRIVKGSGVEDNDLGRCLSLVDAIVEGVDDFDDGIARDKVEFSSRGGHDGQFSTQQDTGINHGVSVCVEPCTCWNLYAQDGDVGLLGWVGGQHSAVPAVGRTDELCDCDLFFTCLPVRMQADAT